MRTSDGIKEIAAALAKAQSEMAGAKKDAMNPAYKSKYADLASVWEAARQALTANGLSVVQVFEPSEKDEVVVTTRLCHASGEWMEGTLALPVAKADAQGYGSAATYARRYSLAAMVGVAPEDDDGNAATKAAPARQVEPGPPRKMPRQQFVDFCTAMSDAAEDEEQLRRVFAEAIRAARAMGDASAEASFMQKKDQLKEAIESTVRG